LAGVSSAYFINLFFWFWIRKIVRFFVSHRPPVTNIIHYNIPPQKDATIAKYPTSIPNTTVKGSATSKKFLSISVSSPECNLVTLHVMIAWLV